MEFNDTKTNNRNCTIACTDGEEEFVFFLRAIYLFPLKPLLSYYSLIVNTMFRWR